MNPTTTLQLSCALLSDIGLKRKQNQDTGLAEPDLGLFMVADGMGGHQGGEIASQLCVEKVAEHVRASTDKSDSSDSLILQQSIQIANQAIYERASKEPQLEGMGTTATILKISDHEATILQVGDSRAYLWNEDGIWQISKDHSLVQEKLRAGLITREQLKSDDMKNVITRSVGYEPNVRGEIFKIEVRPGDGFLLCSDGLSGPVEDHVMHEILMDGEKRSLPLLDAAERLVHAANSNGGDDNVTVLLVKAQGV
ncbi:MAG: Stp1/IreP family PP2C-type Ser/Thr phosphatase [Bdellovibrionales bacterium]|nr:Stp1/IreP family PP2C-type Ser/Thr phosphatase [Bdellovibrionales bacterium]